MFQVLTKGNDFKFSLFLFCIACLLLTFLFYTPAEAQRDENTVAGIWTFDDGTANDTSSQKLNGVVVGTPESVAGIANKALIFLKSTQKSVSINGLSIRGYENAKKCQLICPQYVKNIPYFQYKIE